MSNLDSLSEYTFVHGTGSPGTNTACIMTATNKLLGRTDWSDRVESLDPVINGLAIYINDSRFKDDAKRKAWALERIPKILRCI